MWEPGLATRDPYVGPGTWDLGASIWDPGLGTHTWDQGSGTIHLRPRTQDDITQKTVR